MNITARVIRIRNARLRGALWALVFVAEFVPHTLGALLEGRAWRFAYWDFHWRLFWSVVDGAFV